MTTPIERVTEYVRQRKSMSRDLGLTIHGAHTDPDAEMAELTLPDLVAVTNAARHAPRTPQIAVTVESSSNEYLTYPCEGLLELSEMGLGGYITVATFRVWDGQKLSAPVRLPEARWSYSPETAGEILRHPGPTTERFIAFSGAARPHTTEPVEGTNAVE